MSSYVMTPTEFTSLINNVLAFTFSDYYGSMIVDVKSQYPSEKIIFDKFGYIKENNYPIELRLYFSMGIHRKYNNYIMYPLIKAKTKNGYSLNISKNESLKDKYSFIRQLIISDKTEKDIVFFDGAELLKISITNQCIIRLIFKLSNINLSEYYLNGNFFYSNRIIIALNKNTINKVYSHTIGILDLDCIFEKRMDQIIIETNNLIKIKKK